MDQLRVQDPLSADWVVALLLLAVGVLAYINLAAPKKWRLLTTSLFSLRLAKGSLRDELDLRDRTLVALLTMAAFLVALFAYQVVVVRGLVPPGFGRFLRILVVLVVLVLAQLLVLRSVGVLAGSERGLEEYLYTTLLFYVVLGLLLVPVTALTAFPYDTALRRGALIVGGIAVVGSFALRWSRAVLIGLGEGVPTRFIFLYLCTAEILPVALLCEQARRSIPAPSNPL